MVEEYSAFDRAMVEREIVHRAAKHVREAANEVSLALIDLCRQEEDEIEVSVTWRAREELVYTKLRRAFDELMDVIDRIETADGDALTRVVQEAEELERQFTERTQQPEKS